jgi:hypothetical protein
MCKAFLAFITILFVAGCTSSSSSSGPIDGNYALTAATCNGTAAVGSVVSEAFGSNVALFSPVVLAFSIANTSGTLTVTSGSCSISQNLVISYPASGAISFIATYGYPTCSAGCGTCPTALVSEGNQTYNYSLTGSTLAFSAIAGDTTCSGASPGQVDPVQYTFTTGTSTGIPEGGAGPGTNSSIELDWGYLNYPGSQSITGNISIPTGVPSGETVQLEVYLSSNYQDNVFSSTDLNGNQYTTGAGTQVATVSYEAYNLTNGNYLVCVEVLNPTSFDTDYSGCYNGTSASPLQSLGTATVLPISNAWATSINFGVAAGSLSFQ